MRFRLFGLCAAIWLMASACHEKGSPNRAPPDPLQGRQSTARARPASSGLHCGRIALTGAGYGSHFRPTTGRPGDRVLVFGTTLRNEGGRFVPADRLEVWWNTRVPSSAVPGGTPIRPGPVLLLATVENMDRCRFRTEFRVPVTRPGTYKVVTFVFHRGGYGWFGGHRFSVLPAGNQVSPSFSPRREQSEPSDRGQRADTIRTAASRAGISVAPAGSARRAS